MLTVIQRALLQLLRCALFGGKTSGVSGAELAAMLREAKVQSVFPLVYSSLEDERKETLPETERDEFENDYFTGLMNNVRVFSEHGELHEIMTESGISYVILKGCASALYYPEPELRSMGDVDFLVHEANIPKGIQALEENGFHRDQYEFTTNQSAYLRPPLTTWEIHKSVTGIPKSKEGDGIRKELSDVIEKAELIRHDGMEFYVSSKYHHGVILLLHKISHMTAAGIGLRHLCDWAVFESSFSNDEFVQTFESKLKEFGIWRFAQIMTLVCEKYLGAPKREWAKNPDIKPQLLEAIILDVFAAGNFGKKDANRQREIKYLTDRRDGKPGDKNMLSQAFASLNEKVYAGHPAFHKRKALLPIGWVIEGGRYAGLLISGKRKHTGTADMLKDASKRKKMYERFKLFSKE